MAVNLKAGDDYGWGIVGLLGVDPALIKQAKALGVKIDHAVPGSYQVKYGSTVYGTIQIKGVVISMAKDGTLGPASQQQYKANFTQAIAKAMAAMPGADVTPPEEYPEAKNENSNGYLVSSVLNELKKKAEAPKVFAGVPGPVPLIEATSVYQPVSATSVGSVYYVFAIFDGLNVAARIKGTKLSIRAEGNKLTTYLEDLDGFKLEKSTKDGKHYASAHYDVPNSSLVKQTLGALVGCVGFNKAKAVADLSKFIAGAV